MSRELASGIGRRLRRAREARGLTQQQVADLLARRGVQVTYSAVAQWERGASPSVDKLAAALDVLQASADHVVLGREPEGIRLPLAAVRHVAEALAALPPGPAAPGDLAEALARFWLEERMEGEPDAGPRLRAYLRGLTTRHP